MPTTTSPERQCLPHQVPSYCFIYFIFFIFLIHEKKPSLHMFPLACMLLNYNPNTFSKSHHILLNLLSVPFCMVIHFSSSYSARIHCFKPIIFGFCPKHLLQYTCMKYFVLRKILFNIHSMFSLPGIPNKTLCKPYLQLMPQRFSYCTFP